jgi:uncharacterized protein YgiM (DUF1202 family)
VEQKATRILAIVALVALAVGLVAGQGVAPVKAASFAVGDEVVVRTDFLNLRDGAGLTYDVIDVLPEGTALTVTGSRYFADRYEWYKVRETDGTTGWVAGEYLVLAGDGGGFAVGDTAVVDTDLLNCRVGPGLDYEVDHVMPGGSQVTILDGPTAADGYHWYQLEMENGDVAWAIGEGLAPGEADGGDDSGFALGDVAVVDTDWLNCRSGPGLVYDVSYVMAGGTNVEILDGPSRADGYHWYKVVTEDGDVGWVIGEALIPSSGYDGPGGDPEFAKGAEVVVNTDYLNLRNGAGISKAVIELLPGGTALIVSNGPVAADGYFWYEVETRDGGLGWVVGSYLALATGGDFSVGDAVRVVDGPLNLRAGPDLSEDVIRVMGDNEVLLVEGGPVVADGYTWYQVRNYAGEGWAAGEFLAFEPGGFPAEEGA